VAERILTPEDQAQPAQALDRFETEETVAGVHEASVALPRELKAGAG